MKLMNWNRKYQANPDAASSAGDASAVEEETNVDEGSDSSTGDSSFIDDIAKDFEGREADEVADSSTPSESTEESPPPSVPMSEGSGSPSTQSETPASPPSPQQPESAQAPAPPTQTPSEPVAPTAQETTPTPQEPPKQLSPEEQQAALAKHRTETIAQLQQHYALDDESAAELASDPATALPKMLAQMHYDMTQALFSGVMSQIPTIVQQQTQELQKANELETAFFGKYPGLKQHGEIVRQSLSVALNSGIAQKYEEVEQLAASMAAIKLGVPVETLMGQPTTPTAPAAPRQVPARPIAPGATAGPMSAPRPQGEGANPWADMVEFEIQESSG